MVKVHKADISSSTNASRKVDIPTTSSKNSYDVSDMKSRSNYDYSSTKTNAKTRSTSTSTPTSFDVDNVASARKMDMSSASARADVVDGIKKLESDDYTRRFKDTVTNSSFYKNNKGKLLAMGLTVSAVAGWFGVLLAQGYTPAEAWAIMRETTTNWAEGAAGAAGDATYKAILAMLSAAWRAIVAFVHNSIGNKVFEDDSGTDKALRALLLIMLLQKVLSLFGMSIFGIFDIFTIMR